MKAVAVFPGPRELREVEDKEPQLDAPSHILLRMLEVGICGTDKEICSFQYGTPPPDEDYLILGHESLGEVLEVAGEVAKVTPGDLVVPSVRRPCRHEHCAACRAGRHWVRGRLAC